ncbi:hypothetical protein B0H19DRAFT_1277416 [Mycena capillaripes]|nr:hypothetical protein B0H19DRAFT_1277416 [Mycena capillaripes]
MHLSPRLANLPHTGRLRPLRPAVAPRKRHHRLLLISLDADAMTLSSCTPYMLCAEQIRYGFLNTRPAAPAQALVVLWRKRIEERGDVFGVRLPHAPAVRVPSLRGTAAPLLLTLSPSNSPHPFCVDENPRLTACTAWDCPSALRSHIASIVFDRLLWGRPELNARELHATTGLRLGTRSYNRRSLFYTSSAAIVRAYTHPHHLNHQEAQARIPDELPPPPILLPRISCVAPRSSSTPSTPTAPQSNRRRAPGQAACLLPACTICSRMAARAIRATTWKSLHARCSVPDAVGRPYARDRPGTHPSPSLHHQPHLGLSSPPDACACGTPRHHLHNVLRAQRARWSFPIAGAAFTASSRAKCVSNKCQSPGSMRILNTARTTPSKPALLRLRSTMRSIAKRSKCNDCSLSTTSP